MQMFRTFLACSSFNVNPRILCYHGFTLKDEHQFRPKLFIEEHTFDIHMKYLQDKNYNVISLDDFYKFKEEKNFPDDAAALEIEKEMAALDIKEFEKAGQRAIAYAFGSIPARYAMERKD